MKLLFILGTQLLLTYALTPRPTPQRGIRREVSDATNTFSIDLMKEAFAENSGNIIISPVSVSTLLAILQQGAVAVTRAQLTEVLHADPEALRAGYSQLIAGIKKEEEFGRTTSGRENKFSIRRFFRNKNSGSGKRGGEEPAQNASLEFANGVFLQNRLGIREEFRTILKRDFLSEFEYVDFSLPTAAAARINAWVSRNTHGRIKDLADPKKLLPSMKLFLTNAIYFKSLWSSPFAIDGTRNEPFYLRRGVHVDVPTMHLYVSLVEGYIESLKIRWVEIPFEGSKYSMLVLLPAGESNIDDIVKNFTLYHLSMLMNDLERNYKSVVDLSLPKLKLSTEIDFVPALKKLGLTNIFTPRSQLGKITNGQLMVDSVFQKAEIEIDENGATTSASTGIGVVPISAPLPFKVNRPFLMLVVDKINSIPLFVGKITNPVQNIPGSKVMIEKNMEEPILFESDYRNARSVE